MPRPTNQNSNERKIMPEHIKSVTIISRLNNKTVAKIQVT